MCPSISSQNNNNRDAILWKQSSPAMNDVAKELCDLEQWTVIIGFSYLITITMMAQSTSKLVVVVVNTEIVELYQS
jgi:hypothetical protein